MKILYFHQHFSTPQGATGTRSYEMARRLRYHGHQVTMVCGSYGVGSTGLDTAFECGKRTGVVDGIDVVEFNLSYSNTDGFLSRSWTFLRFSMGSIRLALSERYDIVFATTTPLTAGIPGIFGRWIRRKIFVFEVRDLWPELPREMGVIKNPVILALMSWLEWVSYRSAHRCIALSPGIQNGIARRGVSRDRVTVIPNGCDLEIFSAGRTSAWRPDGVERSELLALYTGTHGVANGLNAILDAALVLKQRKRNDIRLVLVGDGGRKMDLVRRSEQLALSNVLFLPPIGKLRLAGLMAGADVGIQCLANVSAFYYGTSPNKFFDYISAGLPVLNNYPGWLADMINENKCGFVVPPEDPKAFADALEIAASDRAELKRMGENASELARTKFDRSTLADLWVKYVTAG